MGMWQEWCAVSQMHIPCGTPVVMVLVRDFAENGYYQKNTNGLMSLFQSHKDNVRSIKKLYDYMVEHRGFNGEMPPLPPVPFEFHQGTYNERGWIDEIEHEDNIDWVLFIRKDAWDYVASKELKYWEKHLQSEWDSTVKIAKEVLDDHATQKYYTEFQWIVSWCLNAGIEMHISHITKKAIKEKIQLQKFILKKLSEDE